MDLHELNVDRLVRVVEQTDMGMFWREEPPQIHDPPGMRRMVFLHREYAERLAADYERLGRGDVGLER